MKIKGKFVLNTYFNYYYYINKCKSSFCNWAKIKLKLGFLLTKQYTNIYRKVEFKIIKKKNFAIKFRLNYIIKINTPIFQYKREGGFVFYV